MSAKNLEQHIDDFLKIAKKHHQVMEKMPQVELSQTFKTMLLKKHPELLPATTYNDVTEIAKVLKHHRDKMDEHLFNLLIKELSGVISPLSPAMADLFGDLE